MIIMKKNLLLMLFVLGAFAMNAQDLITAEALSKELKNANYVIVSAGPAADYAKVHIAGAISLPYTSFDKPGKPEGLIVSDEEMGKILGNKGISDKNTIVFYDEHDGRYAARMYMLTKYLGAKNVKVLDGGMEAWKLARKPVTKNPSNVKKTTFAIAPVKKWMVTQQSVAAPKANTVIIDTRSPGEFKGVEKNSKGHIPAAINMEYKELLNAKGMMKSKAELEKLYASKGITKDKEIILYCSTGVRTGYHFMALVTILNYTNVKIYDGGYNEWVEKNPSKISK
jgi:thiosulfate/3-mercaptopyruvate sulfurtransferase